MKFIGFWEYKPEDFDKVIEKFKQATAEREKGTERFAKWIFMPHHFAGQCKGFSVFETDNEEKLTNMAHFYSPVMTWKFIPLQETSKCVELWAKMKKGQ